MKWFDPYIQYTSTVYILVYIVNIEQCSLKTCYVQVWFRVPGIFPASHEKVCLRTKYMGKHSNGITSKLLKKYRKIALKKIVNNLRDCGSRSFFFIMIQFRIRLRIRILISKYKTSIKSKLYFTGDFLPILLILQNYFLL